MGPDSAAMEAMYDETLKNFTEGSIVAGKIISVHDGDVLIDIGYKSEGIVPVQEFKDLDEDPVGQEVEVFLEQLEDKDGMIVISKRRAEQQRAWDYVVNECSEGSLVEGTIKNIVKGGFIVDVGVDAFLPGSQLDVVPVRNPEEHLGKTYEFRILKINLERKNIVVSAANSSKNPAANPAARSWRKSRLASSARAWSRTSPTLVLSSISTASMACCT